MRKHLKRLPAPRTWTLSRKAQFWTLKPSPGPHSMEGSVPLGLILRDMLRVCDTAREAQHILNSREVLLDGRAIVNPKFPVGLMDVLSLAEVKAHYRMLINTRGRLALIPLEAAEAKWKLCRIEDKTTVPGGKSQINLHDGRNLLLAKDAYRTGTTLKIHVPGQKILEEFELVPGAVAFISGGQHVGELAHVLDVHRTRNPRANVVTFKEGFSTDIDKVFVVGKDTPQVKIPEAPGL